MQEKLIILRKRNNWTQRFVAEHLGISVRTYTDKELGKVKFNGDEMFNLSLLFKEKIEDIFLPTTHQNGVDRESKKNEE